MAVHVIADVSARYLFNQPLPGTIEIVSLYYMVAVIYLPVAYVQSRRQHIVVTQFTDFQLPTISAPAMAPNPMSVRRDSPRHMTVLPGGGSLARAR